MDDERTLHSKPRAVRKLMDFYSHDDVDRRARTRPWVNQSDSDTSQSDSNNMSSPVPLPVGYGASYGSYSDTSPCKVLRPIGVFWDIENCQVPRGRSAVAVAQKIREHFFDGYREAEFLVVCDVKKETSQVIQELNDAQVSLIHVGSQCKNAADEKLRQSIRKFADIHGSVAVIVLITGDVNFAPDICDLRHRKKIHVILVHNDLCSETMMLCANEHYPFSALVSSLPFRGDVKGVNQPADVVVSSIPFNCDPYKVKQRLRRLAENCGGKVVMLVGDLATVRFPSKDFAIRAQKRMDGEDVFGSQISVSYPMVVRDPSKPAKGMSPVKANRNSICKWEDQRDVSPLRPWNGSFPSTQNPPPGYHGANFQTPFYNQENLPFQVSHLWKNNCTNQIEAGKEQYQTSFGRPILGRRNEPNHQGPAANDNSRSGRHSLDSMLNSTVEVNGGVEKMTPCVPVTNNPGGRMCQTPTPRSLLGVNTSIPPPPIVNLPRSGNNAQYLFHPISVKPESCEETNLQDKIVNCVETNCLLTTAVTQQCSVGNESNKVDVFRHPDVILATGVGRLQGPIVSNMQFTDHNCTPSPASSAGTGELSYCVRHSKPGGADPAKTTVMVHLDEFSIRLVALVNSHDNLLPVPSLMDCYAEAFQTLCVDEHGVPLEHLVTCVRGVELFMDGREKYLRLSTTVSPLNDLPVKDSANPSITHNLNQISQELVELLKTQPGCRIMFIRLIPAYRHHFARHCRVADYGCCKLIELLENLPSVIQVMGEGEQRVVTLAHNTQIRRFTTDLLRVLRSQANKQIVLHKLPVAWEHTIGRKLEPADYGLCYIEDLLSVVCSTSVQIVGSGPETIILIPKRAQTPEEKDRTKEFALKVVELLSLEPLFKLEFSKFISAYHHHFKAQCRVADYGLNKLVDLFEAIPNVVKVEGEGEGERYITLTLPERLKVLANQIRELVLPRHPPGLSLDSLNSAYLWQFKNPLKPALFDCRNLLDVLNKLPTVKVVTSVDGCTLVTPVEPWETRIFCLQTLRILWERSSARMSLSEFEEIYRHLYQRQCSRLALETQLKEVVKITEDGFVQLASLQLFARDVYRLLSANDGRLALSVFDAEMRRTLGGALSPSRYGYYTIPELLQAIDHIVTITGRGTKRVVVLNPELAAVGMPSHPGLVRNGHQHHLFNNAGMTTQDLKKVLNIQTNGESTIPSVSLNAHLMVEQKCSVTNNSEISNHIQPTGPLPIQCKSMTLLSPAEFLKPFLPSSPDPSALPKPIRLTNLTQPNQEDTIILNGSVSDDAEVSDQNKRRLRLAAHFHSPIQLK